MGSLKSVHQIKAVMDIITAKCATRVSLSHQCKRGARSHVSSAQGGDDSASISAMMCATDSQGNVDAPLKSNIADVWHNVSTGHGNR